MMLRPTRDYLLVKPFPRQDSQIIHVVTNKKMVRAKVIAVGKGRYEKEDKSMFSRPLDVKPNDIINFGETPLTFPKYHENGEEYWILQESDIAFIEHV